MMRPDKATRLDALSTLTGDILQYTLELQIGVPGSQHFEKHKPLDLLRRCSQVCQSWRYQIVHSHLLWARCLDLNALCTNHEWRNLVLQRTGAAPLWLDVRITNSEDSDGLYPILLSVLHQHWERIEMAHLGISSSNRPADPRWSALDRPTNTLRSLRVYVWHDGPPYNNDSNIANDIPPLSDNVPALRHLHLIFPNILHLQLQRPWLCQLRSLRIACHGKPLPDILAMVSQLTSLEDLDMILEDSDPSNASELPLDQPQVSIFTLSNIKITGGFGGVSCILHHIIPAPGCCIDLHLPCEMDTKFLTLIYNTLARYTKNFWDVHQSPFVEMTVSRHRFRLHPCSDGQLPNRPLPLHSWAEHIPLTPPEISMTTDRVRREAAEGDALYDKPSLFLLSCLPSTALRSITHLEIAQFPIEYMMEHEQALTRFFLGLVNLEHFALPLTLIVPIVLALGALRVHNSVILPSLRTLKFTKTTIIDSGAMLPSRTPERDQMHCMLEYLTAFAHTREETGLAARLEMVDLDDMIGVAEMSGLVPNANAEAERAMLEEIVDSHMPLLRDIANVVRWRGSIE